MMTLFRSRGTAIREVILLATSFTALVFALGSTAARAEVVVGTTRVWPRDQTPLTVKVTTSGLSDVLISNLEEAIRRWNSVMGDRFVLQRGDVILGKPFIRVSKALPWADANFGVPGYISAWVPHQIWLLEEATPAEILHEIGHVFGLQHAHNHCLRSQYIDVQKYATGSEFTLSSCDQGSVFSYTLKGAPYDFKSLMHYGDNQGLWWKPTSQGEAELKRLGLIRKEGRTTYLLVGPDDKGYGVSTFSPGDIATLRALYP
jgi:hypothetical protein